MVAIAFNAQEFESQRIPDALPEPGATKPPADTDGLTEYERSFLGTHSAFESIGLIDTADKVRRHLELNKQERSQTAALAAAEQERQARVNPVVRAERAQARTEHLSVVNAANVRWREAVARKKALVAELDAEIHALHAEFKRLRDMGA